MNKEILEAAHAYGIEYGQYMEDNRASEFLRAAYLTGAEKSTAMHDHLHAEIERLKGLVHKAYLHGLIVAPGLSKIEGFMDSVNKQKSLWDHFKKQHNL